MQTCFRDDDDDDDDDGGDNGDDDGDIYDRDDVGTFYNRNNPMVMVRTGVLLLSPRGSEIGIHVP